MLNGIGGRTVAEAKQNLSVNEFLSWQAYRQRWGTLNLGARMDWLHARDLVHAAGAGKNGKPRLNFTEVLRYPWEPVVERIATLDDMARAIGLKVK